jgi:hypothetical protein
VPAEDPITIRLTHDGFVYTRWVGPRNQFAHTPKLLLVEIPSEVEMWMEILEKKRHGKTEHGQT